MINKVYDKVKKIIKENYKYALLLFLLLVVLNYPLDYSIMVSGGTINIDDRIEIETDNDSKGSFNMAYVTELRGTIPSVILSYIIPEWTKVPIEDYQVSTSESVEDITKRAKIYLEYSKQAAIKVAFDMANKNFSTTDNKFYVVYKSEETEGDIEIGDILLDVENQKINSLQEFKDIISSKNIGDMLNLTVLRDKEEKDVSVKIKKIDGEKLAGISILNLYDYKTYPNVDLKFNDNESGSSGGLMLSLAIYDKLVEEDLTNGLKIVGTGTIDFDGNVGQIDGVKYKLKGAVKAGADIFLAPSGENYEECMKLKHKKGYKISIIEVNNFNEAIESLKEIALSTKKA